MEYEDLTYEECFNKIFNEININKKSINKLNDIVINQKKEIEELKNEIEDLKKTNEKENLKEINEKIYSCKIENLQFIDEIINEIINNLNVETEEIKEEIKNIQENEIKSLNNNFANLNIEIKEEIKNRKKIEIPNQEINKRNKIMEEENNKIAKHDNEIIVLKQTIEYIQENEIEDLKK
jgi:HD-GYP domain-containing protein (c-di-GMP phosphodiesterase class II)